MNRTVIIDSEIIRGLSSTLQTGLLAVNASEEVMLQEPTTVDGTTDSYIQSADFYLDESQRRTMIRHCIPDFEYQTTAVSLRLYMRDRPQSSAVTKGPYLLEATDTKRDFRASGKIAAMRLTTSANTGWRLGKLLFDVVPLGER
jgi:hypothetical protein